MAVASDPKGAELVRRGRLTRELEPAAFVDVSGLKLGAETKPTSRAAPVDDT